MVLQWVLIPFGLVSTENQKKSFDALDAEKHQMQLESQHLPT